MPFIFNIRLVAQWRWYVILKACLLVPLYNEFRWLKQWVYVLICMS